MPRYVYTQESGDDFKVNTADKADAYEDCNEVRQILDDLGDLLGHTKFDDSYPADASAGGTLGYVKKSNFSATGDPTSTGDDSTTGYAIGSRWINTATDKEFVCLDATSGAAVWEETTLDSFLDLDDTPASYSSGANKFLSVTSGEDAVEFITPIAAEVEISELGTATYDDVQDWINNTQSGGRILGFAITDDSSGGIAISSGIGFIKTTTGNIGLTKSFDLAADAIVSTGLTDNATNYIYVDYNSGSPQILATNDRTAINLQDQFTLGRLYKSSGDLHIINSGVNLYNAHRRMHEMKIEVHGFQRASGGIVSESATTERTLQTTNGIFFLGDTEITTTAQNTSTGGSDYFTYHYYINSAWTSTTGQTAINNTQYNDTSSTGLETLTANRYGVHWGYIHFDSDIHIIYGQGDYTLAQAEEAMVPGSLPSIVSDFGTLASKIIIQKSSTGFKSIVTAYETLFPVSSPSEHNDLGALDTGNYQHLTQAEHDEITQWAGALTLSTGGAINLVTFSTGGTVNIPSGQEFQINGSEVKLDEWATPTTGTTLDATTGVHGLVPIGDADTTHYLAGDISWVSTTGIVLDSLTTPTTGTALNATTGKHGLLLAFDGSATNFLRGDGSWQTPAGAGDVFTSGVFTVGTLTEISTTGGVIKASPFAVTSGDVFDFGAHSAGFTEQQIATTTGTVAVNWNSGNKALYTRSTGTAGGAATFTFTAPAKSMNLMLTIVGTTGGCTGAVTLPTAYWGDATYPTFSTGASAIDGVALYYSTGLTKYLGIGSANFSTV